MFWRAGYRLSGIGNSFYMKIRRNDRFHYLKLSGMSYEVKGIGKEYLMLN